MNRGREILVGVVIVAAVAVAVVGTLWLQGTLWSRNTRSVEVLSRDVGQLMDGNDVKYRGVTIGRVSGIAVALEGEAVRVSLSIDRDLPLPEDPVALLSPESMFGDWQVELAPRSRFPDFDFMEVPEDEPGSVIGGWALPDISRLTATADQISRDIATITERVEVAFTQETATNIARTIDNIEAVSQRLARLVENQAAAVEELGDEVLSTVREIRVAAVSTRRTMEDVDSLITMAQADSIVRDTRIAARNMRIFTDSLANRSDEIALTLARADSSFANLNRILARIEAGEGSLGALVNDTAFLATTRTTMEALSRLLEDLRENPRRYINLSIF